MVDLRDSFYFELKQKLNDAGIKAIIKFSEPAGGKSIKLNGIALFKVLKTPNPFKNLGVAIYRRLTDSAIEKLGGERVKGKNDWVRAPLTDLNYKPMMNLLFSCAERANMVRNRKMSGARKKNELDPPKVSKPKARPKKKRLPGPKEVVIKNEWTDPNWKPDF